MEQIATLAPFGQLREIEVQDAIHIISLAPHRECNDLIVMVRSRIVEEAKNDLWPTIIMSEIYKSILQSEILRKQHLYWHTIEATLAESLHFNEATENPPLQTSDNMCASLAVPEEHAGISKVLMSDVRLPTRQPPHWFWAQRAMGFCASATF